MKKQNKLLLTIAFLLLTLASTQAQTKLGAGLAFGTELSSIGITLKGNHRFTTEWEGSGSFTFFIPKNESEFLNVKLWELNADAHYVVKSTEKFTFYPLAGLSITGVTFDYDEIPNNPFFRDRTFTELGLNVGAGGTLNFTNSLCGFAEVKYVIGGYDQLIANIGILFGLGGS